MIILAIDQGNKESGYITLEFSKTTSVDIDSLVYRKVELYEKKYTVRRTSMGKCDNQWIMDNIIKGHAEYEDTTLVMEEIQSMGMAVGKSVFDTCVWLGRMQQQWLDCRYDHERSPNFDMVSRRDVKMFLCNSVRAKDTNIRKRLIDIYGEPGVKDNPNPITYKVSKDIWSALAIATTYTGLRGIDNA